MSTWLRKVGKAEAAKLGLKIEPAPKKGRVR